MAQDENDEDRAWYTGFMALAYLQGVQLQGRRLLGLTWDVGQPRRLVEEHFFVIAAHQAVEWLDATVTEGVIDQQGCEPYRSLGSAVREIRNMREHGTEYFGGQGRYQHRFVHQDPDRSMAADASSTIITDHGYEIGLRITVEEVLQAVGTVIPTVQATVDGLYDGDR